MMLSHPLPLPIAKEMCDESGVQMVIVKEEGRYRGLCLNQSIKSLKN